MHTRPPQAHQARQAHQAHQAHKAHQAHDVFKHTKQTKHSKHTKHTKHNKHNKHNKHSKHSKHTKHTKHPACFMAMAWPVGHHPGHHKLLDPGASWVSQGTCPYILWEPCVDPPGLCVRQPRERRAGCQERTPEATSVAAEGGCLKMVDLGVPEGARPEPLSSL